ncbi:MAG: BBP7 family outer membrane beta-barrel protein [Pirellulales bacterium]
MNSSNGIYSDTNQLSTPIDLGFVDYGGTPAINYFDNAREHYVTRSDEFHNFELNYVKTLIGNPCGGGCNFGGCGTCDAGCGGFSPVTVQFLTGFRYINFNDSITFGSSQQGFGVDPATDAYLGSAVQNNLYGWQIGAMFQHNVTCNFSWFVTPKVGVFANTVDFCASSVTGDGVQGNFTSTGNNFFLTAQKTDFAVVGQIDLGVNYRIGKHWSITGGYRVLGMSGIAIADEQIPAYLAAEGDWTDLETSSSTIYHGAFAGVQFCW